MNVGYPYWGTTNDGLAKPSSEVTFSNFMMSPSFLIGLIAVLSTLGVQMIVISAMLVFLCYRAIVKGVDRKQFLSSESPPSYPC